MVLIGSVLTALTLVSGALAAPSMRPPTSPIERSPLIEEGQSTPNGQGIHDGYFYLWWSDGASPAIYSNGPKGSYSLTWQSPGNLVGGKGWETGSRRKITFSANWEPVEDGNSYLMIYGEARNPRAEYYIIEAHGRFNPGSTAMAKGSVVVDGATYKLYHSTRVFMNAPILHQYWAIRDEHRTSGTVDTGKIFDAWAAAGLKLGDLDWQIVATEAYFSAGQSQVTVSTPA